ncbi:DNA-directed RNA polymerase subunit K [Candidatus Woesearchaeota archaeon]|nr:DNA-directed RNA polymerase subunit K [Candidatus Woesearchaeota archaeon]
MEYTKYEKARMIGSRALQISMGAPLMLEMKPEELEAIGYNPIKIATKEFEAGVIPLTIKRPMPGQKTRALAAAVAKK